MQYSFLLEKITFCSLMTYEWSDVIVPLQMCPLRACERRNLVMGGGGEEKAVLSTSLGQRQIQQILILFLITVPVFCLVWPVFCILSDETILFFLPSSKYATYYNSRSTFVGFTCTSRILHCVIELVHYTYGSNRSREIHLNVHQDE